MFLINKIIKYKSSILCIAILHLINIVGRIFGYLSLMVPSTFFKGVLSFRKGFCTAKWKFKFGQFGSNASIGIPELIINPEYVTIGDYTEFGQGCVIETHQIHGMEHGQISIGRHCVLGSHIHITSANKISIGDNILTGRYVLITDNSHGNGSASELNIHPAKRELSSKGSIFIGNNVWLADKVSIMPGVSIGDNVIIAANAVVTHDIPSNSIAAGVPAKVIKTIQ